jgi:hypothetical protein
MGLSVPTLIDIDVNNKFVATLNTWVKFGTVFLIYRLLSHYLTIDDSELISKQNLVWTILILIGFGIYFLVVKPHVAVDFKNNIVQRVANDTLMFGTVLVSSHLLNSVISGSAIMNHVWLKNAVSILLGLAVYNVIVEPVIAPRNVIVSDVAKYGTAMLSFRLLQGERIDVPWLVSTGFVLTGLTVYNTVANKLIVIE